jgi:hypothetical protein
MEYYRRITQGFTKASMIPATVNPQEYKPLIMNRGVDWYISTWLYTQEHYDHFKKHKSVAGLTDLITDKIWFDIDCENELDTARFSTKTLVERLLGYGFDERSIQVVFSGNKGFHVLIDTINTISQDQISSFAEHVCGDLEGFDTSLYDYNQILRIPLTKHNKNDNYCYPLTIEQLMDNELTMGKLVELSQDITEFDTTAYTSYYIPIDVETIKEFNKFKTKKPEKKTEPTTSILDKPTEQNLIPDDVDMKNKPSNFDDARWLLHNGIF